MNENTRRAVGLATVTFICFTIITLPILISFGKKEGPESATFVLNQEFGFQVIKSPLTGKCYETVSHTQSHSFSHIFEISCEKKE